MLRVFCPAKVNLLLHVSGRREDGYHNLDSLITFASIGDTLMVEKNEATVLEVLGGNGLVPTGADNSIIKAQQVLERTTNTPLPARFVLHKRMPVAAGVGAGSANAAATIKALIRLYGLKLDSDQQQDAALACGADVPVCLYGRTARVQGIGEAVLPQSLPYSLPALLVNPGMCVATVDVFRELAASAAYDRPPAMLALEADALRKTLLTTGNTMQPVAIGMRPVIAQMLDVMQGLQGCWLARMTGSGATCFALFDTPLQAEAAQQTMQQQHPQWWARACWLG